MKTILATLLLGCALAACNRSPEQPETAAASEVPTVAESPAPAATPEPPKAEPPPAPVAVAAPTPAPNYFAPEGVYFLTTSKSVETDDGLIGLKPGTKVLRQSDGTYLAEKHKLTLAPTEVTNDLRVAARVANADAAAQAAIQKAMAATPVRKTPVAHAATADADTSAPAGAPAGTLLDARPAEDESRSAPVKKRVPLNFHGK